MEKYRIEHVVHPVGYWRLYDMLRKMDNYMMPLLSQHVCLKAYTKKLVEKADIFYIIYKEQDCGHCAVYMNNGSKAYITSFGILPEFQGMGMGNTLIHNVICEAELRGINQIGLEVHRNNVVAHRLYVKAGFRQSAETGEMIKMVMNLYDNT